jgi:tetratricopeptide (TPR) repeat protein
MKLDPSYSNAYFNCGDVMYQMGLSNQAAELYRAGLSQSPDYAEGWFVLGNALSKAGRHFEAREAYETALAKAPQHDRAQHNLDLLPAA